MWTPRLFRLQVVSWCVQEKFTANSPLPQNHLELMLITPSEERTCPSFYNESLCA